MSNKGKTKASRVRRAAKNAARRPKSHEFAAPTLQEIGLLGLQMMAEVETEDLKPEQQIGLIGVGVALGEKILTAMRKEEGKQ